MPVDGDLQAREDQMRVARQRINELALQGMSAGEIASRVDPGLNETERYLVWRLAREAVARARKHRIGEALRRSVE
jgi:hypothetical protein